MCLAFAVAKVTAATLKAAIRVICPDELLSQTATFTDDESNIMWPAVLYNGNTFNDCYSDLRIFGKVFNPYVHTKPTYFMAQMQFMGNVV